MSRPPTTPVGPRRGRREPADVRRHNAAVVFRAVRRHGPLSRAQIAAHTGLTRATVGSIVDGLRDAGLLEETGAAPGGGVGRPGTNVAVAPAGAAGIGLELGVDGPAVVVLDLGGTIRHRATRAAPRRPGDAEALLREGAALVDDALAAAEAAGLTVRGVGVAVPGLVDLDAGTVRLAPNLGWEDVPVLAELVRLASRPWPPTTLDNEANLAALGELASGEHGDTHSFVLVNGGVGVGAGVVLEGRLYRGSRGFSGELGHLTVAPEGPECRCGATGCLEQAAGLERLLRGTDVEATEGSAAVDALVEALRRGDRSAAAATVAVGTALGVGVAALVNLFDVDTVVLGGAYAPLFEWLAPPVREVVARRVISARWAPITVTASALGPDAAVVGAAGAALAPLLADPLDPAVVPVG